MCAARGQFTRVTSRSAGRIGRLAGVANVGLMELMESADRPPELGAAGGLIGEGGDDEIHRCCRLSAHEAPRVARSVRSDEAGAGQH